MSFVRVLNLSKSYGDIKAVDDFSFDVEKGEIYALVGPDGAGKTTIMRALANLLQPDSGQLRINGIDVQREFERVKPLLGYMPQTFSLYPDLSVEENLVFYAGIFGVTGKRYQQRRDALYAFSNLEPFAGRRAGALSGGMKQKLALSCALIHDPELLVLDEPTTGVDPLSRRQFWEMLASLKSRGVTVLVSTPYMDEVARTDRACFVFDGRKLAEGTPDELRRQFSGRVYVVDADPNIDLVNLVAKSAQIQSQRFGARVHLYTADDVTLNDMRGIL
ncbi:MAG: ABC transporter ATP-binding protein, partial [Candidatus Zixiibacteriota bacterium]